MICLKKVCLTLSGLILIGLSQHLTGSGVPNHHYEIQLSAPVSLAPLLKSDRSFFDGLVQRFNYKDSVIIYSLTNLKVIRDGKTYEHLVYRNGKEGSQLLIELQNIEKSSYRIVANLRHQSIGRPGTGGISYHLSKSKKHIMCLNGPGNSDGIPINDGNKGGFPKPAFTAGSISWYYY